MVDDAFKWDTERFGDRPSMHDSAAQRPSEPAKSTHGQRAREQDAITNAHDTRLMLTTRRCQRDNVLMEPLGVLNAATAFFCAVCNAVQLRPFQITR